MKIAVSGDYHLDCSKIGITNPETDLDLRIEDFLKAFDFMIDTSIAEGVDIFVLNGDLFKGRTSSHHLETLVAQRCKKIASKMKLIINLGNHDYTPKLLEYGLHTYSILEGVQIENTLIYLNPTHISFDGLDIVFYPYHDIKRTKHANNEELIKWLEETFKSFNLTQPCKLFIGHGTPQGTIINEDFFFDLGSIEEPLIPQSLLEQYDMALFSHIHRRHFVTSKIFHIGSPERVDFSEADEDKGFVIFNSETKDLKWISTNPRPMFDLKLDLLSISEFDDPSDIIINKLKSLPNSSEALLKLEVNLSESNKAKLDYASIQEALKSFKWYKNPSFKSPKETKTRIKEVNEQATPIQSLQKVLDTKDLSDSDKEQILLKARGIIEGSNEA